MNKTKPSGLALAGRQLFYMSMPLIALTAVCLVVMLLRVIGLIS